MIILEELGYFVLGVRGPDGETVEQRLDLWKVNNRLFALQTEYEGKPLVDFHQAVVEYLQQLGFPECSHMLAASFIAAVRDAMEALQKKSANGSANAGSHAFTESTRSTPASPAPTS